MFEFLKKKKTEPVQVASEPPKAAELSAGLGSKPKRNMMLITMKDGAQFSLWLDNWEGANRVSPWREFYRWYFGRKSNSYVIRWRDGERMIRRKDIKRFEVTVVDAA